MRKRKRKWLARVVVVLTGVVLICWSGSLGFSAGKKWISGTSWSILEQVEVSGLIRLPEHDILTVLNLKPGLNLMKLELDSISSKVMDVTGVKYARAVRRLPGRLVIKVEERVPIAAMGNGELILIDDEGIPFPPVYSGEVLDIPIITGKIQPVMSDSGYVSTYELLMNIKNNYTQIYDYLGEIMYKKGELKLRLRQGGALVGSVDDDLLDDLELFLTQKGGELPAEMDYVDFRFPAMVITGTSGS
ncbi:FtsQ-type POTRA domain-containing protein [bacterium]|nr:FtsQ-type POTRA domain-containing protein [bacterium]